MSIVEEMDILIDKETSFPHHEHKSLEDDLVDSLLFMKSPWPITIIVVSYLVFVLKLGPQLMANRKPFDLKHLMIIYNVVQVVANAWFLLWFFSMPNMFSYVVEQSCYPTEHRPLDYRLFAIKVSWVWLLTKLSDLVDTIFFVLRKKQSHISFLHIYHHTSMVVTVWLYIKYVRGEQGIMIGLVNSNVHIVMYSYYFLAALGPGVQKYLWWKKYITKLQLVQFWILTVFFAFLSAACTVPPLQQAYNYYAVSQGIGFTILFLNFYFKSYTKKQAQSVSKNSEPHEGKLKDYQRKKIEANK